jgi:hypothetical protein
MGIEDKTIKSKPISEVQRLLGECLNLAPQLTEPAVSNINGEWLESDAGSHQGFVLIHIPESTMPPHRVLLNNSETKNHYYIRSGDSFIIAPHAQLEDMFGRRPKPVYLCSSDLLPDA